jgi:hypothetical protein
MCRDGRYNETSGRCAKLVKSKNKGRACKSDKDCPTTDPDAFAKCRCGFSTKGTKYCDIEGADDEWVNSVTSFQSYIENTLDCHTAEGFGICNNTAVYKTYKCAELQA